MASAAAIVLCGGRSSRMGRAKAWLPWRGRPMIAHVVESLREGGAVDEVVVVSSTELPLPPLSATLVHDRQAAGGPLAGIREGLAHMKADLAYATSTDAPFLTSRFVTAMLAWGDAAAPEVDGFVQTLAAVYPRRALAFAEQLLAANKRRPLQLLEAVGYRKVRPEDLPDITSLRGFNTPEEYLKALKESGESGPAVLELRGAARESTGRSEWEIPVGTLAEALEHVPGLEILEPNTHAAQAPSLAIAPAFCVELPGSQSISHAGVPIGPGERVIVTDAGA